MTGFTRRSLLATTLLPTSLMNRSGALAQNSSEIILPKSLGPSIPPELLAPSGNWPAAQGNLAATRSAVGSSIDSSNVGQLGVIWEFPIQSSTGYGGMTATPVVIDDLVYVQDMLSNVFALDRATGAVRWQQLYGVPSIGPNGVAVGYGMLFAALGDTAEVVALDASTGKEAWRVRLSNNPGEGIDMAPAVYDSTVYISTVPGNTRTFNRGGTRGILFALEAATGATLWQFDTTTNNLWGNPRINSGGGIWCPPSFDDTGGIYFGVANAAPWPGTKQFPNGSSRLGPNDYASSMVALDRDSGAIRWHYNAAEHDLLDHDFQNSPLLIEVKSGGVVSGLAIGSGKTGTVVAVDVNTGIVRWATPVGRHEGDTQEFLPETSVEIFPGAWGGVLTPIAASHDRVYIPVVNQPTRYSASEYDKVSMFTFSDGTGELVAINVLSGDVVWQTEFVSPCMGGATLVNDLVVTSSIDGLFRVFHTETGESLLNLALESGINACPAIAGELIILPAAGIRVASSDTREQTETISRPAVVCLGIIGNR